MVLTSNTTFIAAAMEFNHLDINIIMKKNPFHYLLYVFLYLRDQPMGIHFIYPFIYLYVENSVALHGTSFGEIWTRIMSKRIAPCVLAMTMHYGQYGQIVVNRAKEGIFLLAQDHL